MLARLRLYKLLAPSISVALGGFACNADFSGFDDLLDPAATFVNFPGRQVTSLETKLPGVEGTDSAGAMIVTFEQKTGRLLVFPFDGGPPCSPGVMRSFDIFPYSLRSELTPYFPVLEPATAERGGRLRFIGPGCEEPLAPSTGASLPFRLFHGFVDPPGYLAPTTDDRLLFLEPWAKQKRTVAEGVQSVRLVGDFSLASPDKGHLWTIEGGEIIGRNRAFSEFARFGNSVVEWAVSSGPERVAYVERAEGEGVGTLYLVDVKTGAEPELIDEDVCGVTFPSGWGASGLSYFSPCADRRLVLFDIARSREGDEEYRFVLRENALRDPIIDRLTNPYAFFFTADEAGADHGTLWGGRLGGTPQRVSDYASVNHAPYSTGTRFQLLIDRNHHDGEYDTDTLVDWEPGTPPVELLRDVRRVIRPFVIANYDGVVGDAYRVDAGGNTQLLARRVPREGITSDDVGTAILTDYDGDSGTLLAAREKSLNFEVVAEGVAEEKFKFIPDIGAIAYLREWNAEKKLGLLGVRVLDTADTFDIDLVATNWVVTFWPEAGVFYTVSTGPTRGLWFARLR